MYAYNSQELAHQLGNAIVAYLFDGLNVYILVNCLLANAAGVSCVAPDQNSSLVGTFRGARRSLKNNHLCLVAWELNLCVT